MRQPTRSNRKRREFRICPVCQVEFCSLSESQRWCSTDCSRHAKRLAGGALPIKRQTTEEAET
jgi:hypothetical protein